MQCLECLYQLDGLPDHQCPECGRGFDPTDPRTYWAPDRANREVSRRFMWTAMACATSPLLMTLCMFLAYAVGWMVLGRWPETGGWDNPKSIPIVDLMHMAWMFGAIAIPALVCIGLALVAVISMRRRRVAIVMLLAALGSWGLALLLNRWIDVWGWFFD